eukprot:TRINITY_DN5535_c0_g1_i2.p1 TRINITY_DN5535_c0_g1~~TRINITY_DN5535_c0_g1_i2.p1  ORF type:complete len:713 (+),score=274.80 TRINITY_DN5535_c0_g1_i2:111-2141(+)
MATIEQGNATGISVWLAPKRGGAYDELLGSLVRNANPGNYFAPHVTLISLPDATRADVERVVEAVKQLAKQFKPADERYTTFKTGSTFYKNIFVELALSDNLKAMRDASGALLNAPSTGFEPHLSLFYGQRTDDIVSRLASAVKAAGLENSGVRLDTLEVWLSEGQARDWVHLGSSTLGEGLFFRSALLIDGQWRAPTRRAFLPVVNPANKDTFHHFPAGTIEDIDAAVAAAKAAFPSWSKTTGEQRAVYLRAIATKLREKKAELALTEVLDNGKAISEASNDIEDTAGCFDYYAQQAAQLDSRQNEKVALADSRFSCHLRFEPIGVAGLIVPWNYPLMMAAWKVAPCLAAGCTAVLKPSELTPLSALELGAIALQVGLPAGVLNVVTGLGTEAGQPLSVHPDVEKIAFTGSVPTGAKIAGAGAAAIKKVSLELGGKSPFIIFDDSSLEQAVEWIMFGIFANQGQVCSATSRLLVQDTLAPRLLPRLVEEAKKIKIGSGVEEATKLGPLVSEVQYNRVRGFIRSGLEQGATLATGGLPSRAELLSGYFVEPTIFVDVKPEMAIWREEIFGPVLSVMTFATEEEAVALANDSTYGLAGGVMSRDRERCTRVANALQVGVVWINCSQPCFVEAPWGGYKRSGTGRELGPYGINNFLEIKQVTSYEEEGGLGYQWYIKA